MAIKNLSAFADRAKYLVETRGMSEAEAIKKVTEDAGFVGEKSLSNSEMEGIERLMGNKHYENVEHGVLMGNDAQATNQAEQNETYSQDVTE